MDFDTAQKIRLLGKKVPKELRRKLTYQENVLERQKMKAQKILSTGRDSQGNLVSRENQKRIEDLMKRGSFDGNQEIVDKKVEAKMEKIMDRVVRDAIRRGELPDPKVAIRQERDPAIRERLRKQYGI